MVKRRIFSKMGMVYIGVDPGVNGGIAAVLSGGSEVVAIKMPATEKDLFDYLTRLDDPMSRCRAVIEAINPGFPGTGKSQMAKLFGQYCAVRMAMTASGISYETVTPNAWQKGLKIPGRKKTEMPTQWKNRLKAKAQQLFPSVKVTLQTCDALLIAEYCRRLHEGVL